MADLLWIGAKSNDQLLADVPLAIGQSVKMRGRDYGRTLPKRFDLWRMYSPIIRGAASLAGKPPGRHRAGDSWPVKRVAPGTAQSELLRLAASRFTGTHRWQFTDGTSWSSTVRTTRFGTIEPEVEIETPDFVPVKGTIGVKVTIPTGLADPTVALSVVLPWETNSPIGTVHDVIKDELIDDDRSGAFEEALYGEVMGSIGEYLPDERPDGWEIWLTPQTVDVEPGQPERATLEIRVGRPAGLAMAIGMVDVANRERRAVSDVFVVKGEADGSVSFLFAD